MATVTYQGTSYECHKAFKGSNYIHLVDAAGHLTVAFDGVNDFSLFSISGGSWTTPTETSNCYLAVMRIDGTIAKSSIRACDI